MTTNDASLARLEVEVEHLKATMDEVKANQASMNAKLQLLLDAANMGKGAWWIILKLGAFVSITSAAGLWVYEKIRHLIGVKL